MACSHVHYSCHLYMCKICTYFLSNFISNSNIFRSRTGICKFNCQLSANIIPIHWRITVTPNQILQTEILMSDKAPDYQCTNYIDKSIQNTNIASPIFFCPSIAALHCEPCQFFYFLSSFSAPLIPVPRFASAKANQKFLLLPSSAAWNNCAAAAQLTAQEQHVQCIISTRSEMSNLMTTQEEDNRGQSF